MQLPAYSIVIPTYGQKGLDLLKRLLPLLAYSCRLSHEVIVVDDGSEENVAGELELVCRNYGAMMLHDAQNNGFAAACNAGITHANGFIVMLCNNDIIPIGNTFDALSEFTFFTGFGIVGCRLLYPDNRIQHAGVYYVPPPEGQKHGWFDHFYRFNDRHFIGASRIDRRLCTGALLAINGGIINAIGGLDERYGMAAEDIDYELRAMEAGASVVYNGYIEAYHVEGATRGNTVDGKAAHPEWTEKEEKGLDHLFDKWYGLDFTKFAVTT